MEAIVENVMRRIDIEKVTVNIGVGRSGEPLERAKKVLEGLFKRNPCMRKAKGSIREFGVHRGEPIAVVVTLRGKECEEALKRLLAAKDGKVSESSFDVTGNCSFGIKEHIEIPGTRYDPSIGIFGMDVSVNLSRPGYRVKGRRRGRGKIGKDHIVSREEAIQYFRSQLGVEVVGG